MLVFTAARLVYLAFFSPFTLIEDEAHYWAWAQSLDWSYYSKGPGVAWVIALSTAIIGDTEFGVRAPTVISGAISAIAVAGLGRSIFRDGRVGFFAAAMLFCMPVHVASSILMTIDGPYLACWAIAAWAAWVGLTRGHAWAWAGFGLALAVGFLFKYTILIMPIGVVLFAVLKRRHVVSQSLRGPLLGVGAALRGLVPVLIWNAQNDWVTVRHLMGHLGLAGGDVVQTGESTPYNPLWTLEYIGFQAALGGPAVFLGLLGLINIRRSHKGDGDRPAATWTPGGPAYLAFVAAPMFVFYGLVTVVTNVEANWTAAGFITLAPLAGWAAVDGQDRADKPLRVLRSASIFVFALFSLTIVTVGVVIDGPLRERFPGLGRISMADDLAREAEQLATQTFGPDAEPIYMTVHYGRASLLGFYLTGRPEVYSAQALLGGRKTQFDVWAETDLNNTDTIERLRGRPAVMLGGRADLWAAGFAGVVEHGKLPAEPKADRVACTAERFTAFPTK